MNKEMKLTGKDLINIGIYTAILFVLNFLAMFTGIVPTLWIVLPGTTGILTAIPFTLMNLKVRKPGAILIMGLVVALLYFLSGQFTVLLLATFVAGCLVAEIVRFAFRYKDTFISLIISFVAFCYGMIGSPLPIWLYGDSFFAQIAENGMTQEYIKTLQNYTSFNALIVMLISPIVGGILGMLISKLLFKKHLKKAGIV
ncbi:MptD family putative ECF transporter S component [Dorea formicigenerans]|uniref:Trep_Strep domain-containing protein n=1 Tax=Dorea formicigenerans TaxID=39486 RepID=A0A564TWG6_9FIRM|nr:MptD family putative ECF transporter S component [Dorea formicigenerans]VUX11579.1 Uncharacterised protein [Dorea formicigenerans]